MENQEEWERSGKEREEEEEDANSRSIQTDSRANEVEIWEGF